MFTGLIEHVGTVVALVRKADGAARLRVDLGPLAADAHLGDSIAVNGCCLTIAAVHRAEAEFDAVAETLRRSTLGALAAGARVNLERAVGVGHRLGGHFVQGHVDGTATLQRADRGGEWRFVLDAPALAVYVVEKGSVALDGISLTVAGCDGRGAFHVALIPETLDRTTLGGLSPGAKCNVETDVIGKYVYAMLAAQGRVPPAPAEGRLTEAWLKEQGY